MKLVLPLVLCVSLAAAAFIEVNELDICIICNTGPEKCLSLAVLHLLALSGAVLSSVCKSAVHLARSLHAYRVFAALASCMRTPAHAVSAARCH